MTIENLNLKNIGFITFAENIKVDHPPNIIVSTSPAFDSENFQLTITKRYKKVGPSGIYNFAGNPVIYEKPSLLKCKIIWANTKKWALHDYKYPQKNKSNIVYYVAFTYPKI